MTDMVSSMKYLNQFKDQCGVHFQNWKVYVAGSAWGQDQFQDRYEFSVSSGVG